MSDDDRAELGKGMRSLPPHPEVHGAMEQLRDAGFRLATLTNSTLAVSQAQMANAGLDELLERLLSADTVRWLKPAPEPYLMAAVRLGVLAGGIRLVAAHSWDIAGAPHAGLAAACVARPGQVLDPTGPQPENVESNLQEVAKRILVKTG